MKSRATLLYRIWDAHGRLLYIGITNNFGRRINEHRKSQPWASQIYRHETEHFTSRSEAVEAERLAIMTENPLHNVTHSQTNSSGVSRNMGTPSCASKDSLPAYTAREAATLIGRSERLIRAMAANGRLEIVSTDPLEVSVASVQREIRQRRKRGRYVAGVGSPDASPSANLGTAPVETYVEFVRHALETTSRALEVMESATSRALEVLADALADARAERDRARLDLEAERQWARIEADQLRAELDAERVRRIEAEKPRPRRLSEVGHES